MAKSRVYNDNKFMFEQEFKGEKITILAGDFVEMDYDDAIQFKSMYYPPKFDGSGVQKPESYKMLRVVGQPPNMESSGFVCAACGDKFATETELDSHVNKNHLNEMEDVKEAEKRRKTQKI
jgi:uncharacterized C2H2 Zn-finger protein